MNRPSACKRPAPANARPGVPPDGEAAASHGGHCERNGKPRLPVRGRSTTAAIARNKTAAGTARSAKPRLSLRGAQNPGCHREERKTPAVTARSAKPRLSLRGAQNPGCHREERNTQAVIARSAKPRLSLRGAKRRSNLVTPAERFPRPWGHRVPR